MVQHGIADHFSLASRQGTPQAQRNFPPMRKSLSCLCRTNKLTRLALQLQYDIERRQKAVRRTSIARDIADAILQIAPRLLHDADVSGTYHFTADGVTSWHGFASRVVAAQASLTGRNPRVTPIATADYPTAAKRPANSHLDCRLFAKVFGLTARHWTESVDATTRTLVTSSQRTANVA